MEGIKSSCKQIIMVCEVLSAQAKHSRGEAAGAGGKPAVRSMRAMRDEGREHIRPGCTCATSLREEASGAVVNKHVGPGHPNVHLRRPVNKNSLVFSTPSLFLFIYLFMCLHPSSGLMTDKKKEKNVSTFSSGNNC